MFSLINKKSFPISEVIEGKNCVLFETNSDFILYEKLANTIHSGKKQELLNLRQQIESFNYNPKYESGTLMKREGEKLGGLLLNVTESCNFNCSYCIYSGIYQNEHKINSSNMNFEVAKKAIDLFIPKSNKIALIAFYGGEPLNNMPLIKKIIYYTRKTYPTKKTIFSMTSNFYDADKYLEDFVREDIYINISLDGSKDIHDKFRKHKTGKPTWNKIINNLKKLDEFSVGYVQNHIGYSVTCADPEDFLEIVDYFDNKNFNVVRLGGIEQKGLDRDFTKDINLSKIYNLAEKYLKSLLIEKNISKIYKTFFDQKLKSIATRSRKKIPKNLMLSGSCYPGNRKLFVDTNGEFYMCEKFGRRLSIGNVNNGINHNSINKAIKRFLDIKNDYCTKGCWAQRLCTPCIHSAKDSQGDISTNGLSQTCNSSKFEIIIAFTIYTSILKRNSKYIKEYIKSINFS